MPLKDSYVLPAAADMHVHLRNAPGPISQLVTPTIHKAGVDVVFVMPNLVPPVVSVAEALEYKRHLQAIDSTVTYLMSLYLHSSITPDEIREAKKAAIAGVKAYPKGATTNSEFGIVSFEPFYEVLRTMEEEGVVLNLHGEMPKSSEDDGITNGNAESKFLPTLRGLVARFPKLKIVLEHCTTADAVETVRSFGDNVVGTITAHHLSLLEPDWASNVNNYCKPSAKTPEDRRALLDAVVHSSGKFFLGTDSAPHDVAAKKGKAAGVFTQPYALSYVLTALEEGIARGDIPESAVADATLRGFFSEYGRAFYGIEKASRNILLKRGGQVIPESLKGDGAEIVPFRAGEITWSVEWQ